MGLLKSTPLQTLLWLSTVRPMRSQLREHVSIAGYIAQCSMFIEAIHPVWLKAQIIPIMSYLFPVTTLWLTLTNVPVGRL
jgi:hypothetical protein